MRRNICALILLSVLAAPGCARLLDGWTGKPAAGREVEVPADRMWEQLFHGIDALDLTVTSVSPERRVVQLAWIAPEGDGRSYLRCEGDGPVGNAFLQPRIVIRSKGSATVIEVSSIGKATVADGCTSNGRFEGWLLDRLGATTRTTASAVTPEP